MLFNKPCLLLGKLNCGNRQKGAKSALIHQQQPHNHNHHHHHHHHQHSIAYHLHSTTITYDHQCRLSIHHGQFSATASSAADQCCHLHRYSASTCSLFRFAWYVVS